MAAAYLTSLLQPVAAVGKAAFNLVILSCFSDIGLLSFRIDLSS